MAPASASATVSMCACIAVQLLRFTGGVAGHDQVDLLRMVGAMGEQHAAHGVFRQVRIGAGEELGDLAGIGCELGHRRIAGGTVVLARASVMALTAPQCPASRVIIWSPAGLP